MTESQIAVMFAVLAILTTAGALFRLGALSGKALAVVVLSTTGLGTFLVWTLSPA